jgi:hypothetical protein
MLKTLSVHSSDLCKSLYGVDQHLWREASEWLHVAASVKRVEMDTIQYEPGFGYCSGGDEYSISREKLLTTFVSSLSVFLFIWGGLEAALDIFRLPQKSNGARRGKIGDACRTLTSGFDQRPVIAPYYEEVGYFRNAIRDCPGYADVESRFGGVNDIGAPGIGLYAVYKIRNHLAHGSLAFPQPDRDRLPTSSHANLIDHAARIVLLSLQMLLLQHYRDHCEFVSRSWDADSDDEEVPLQEVLRTLHFVRDDDPDQLLFSLGY